MSYQGFFAYYYDKLNVECDYESMVDFYTKVFKKLGQTPKLVLDLGCGSGNITVPMAERGYEMIGLDLSFEMLQIAQEKARAKNKEILFLNQDMTDFELYGTVDAVICALDGMNYLTDKRDLLRCFKLCSLYLNPQGLLIFDINTPYKFEHILGDNTFVYDMEDVYCVWQNRYDKKSKLCEFDITIFAREEERFVRYDEVQVERGYTLEEIENLLKRAGFTLEGVFDDKQLTKPKQGSERVFCVARKTSEAGTCK